MRIFNILKIYGLNVEGIVSLFDTKGFSLDLFSFFGIIEGAASVWTITNEQ